MYIYFSCCITTAPVGFLTEMLRVVNALEKAGHKVWFPPRDGKEKDNPVEIYAQDNVMIKRADCVIACLTHPSLGVGAELMFAKKVVGIPTICFSSGRVSKYIQGLVGTVLHLPNVHLPETYEGKNDLSQLLEKIQ